MVPGKTIGGELKIYAAATPAPQGCTVMNTMTGMSVLYSFATVPKIIDRHNVQAACILDSGAFTAWASGVTIDLDEYSAWVRKQEARWQGKPFIPINLDVIPGAYGLNSTLRQRQAGMVASLENADYLRSLGHDTLMEVFHQDEPFDFLDLLLDRLPEGNVLGLSPRNDVDVTSKMAWQRQVLAHLMRRYKTPDRLPRTHGLAVTSTRLLYGFPYFSTDSSTWISPLRYGTFVHTRGKVVKGTTIFPRNIKTTEYEGLYLLLRRSLRNLELLERDVTTAWKGRGVEWN